MSLRLKFNLVLAGVLLLAVLGAGAYVHRFLQQSAIEEVQHNSQIMMHAAMAIRDYTTDKHHVTDDYAYGGGGGMVMKPDPIFIWPLKPCATTCGWRGTSLTGLSACRHWDQDD